MIRPGLPESDAAACRLLVDESLDLMQEVDAAGAVVMTNRAWREALGYSEAEAAALSIWQVVEPGGQEAYRRAAADLGTETPVVRLSTNLLRRDGTAVEVEGSLRALAPGSVGPVLGVFRPLRRPAEIEALKRQLLMAVGHELRAPLTAIVGALDLLASPSEGTQPLSREQAELLEVSHRNAERLLTLVNDLLDLQKLYAGTLAVGSQPCDLAPLVEDTAASLQGLSRNQGVTLETRFEAGLWP
ncbi:MAG: PAS domain S-box protein, partial [Acidobacteria bacterium]|nr:PAS domain S-box protein [Acidobacteriota bacterium]